MRETKQLKKLLLVEKFQIFVIKVIMFDYWIR